MERKNNNNRMDTGKGHYQKASYNVIEVISEKKCYTLK